MLSDEDAVSEPGPASASFQAFADKLLGCEPKDSRPYTPIGLSDSEAVWIGPYRLLEEIGRGGFGVVWLAERREPMVQRVAVKVIKSGMDSDAVIARFEQERQALAIMDHPHIAKVFDGGVTSPGQGSRPFFVMEYFPGIPITDYCDRHRLSIKQRLALFSRVCEAVQHAHTKGIIHRDLKPSNVLVAESDTMDAAPNPKVIDFGVAKAMSRTLTDLTIHTERGQMIGTPGYMSPEQAEMSAAGIDTRSDVYSLGVLLYELLTGQMPFDPAFLKQASIAQIQQLLREIDPPTPSARLSTIGEHSGDLVRVRKTRLRTLVRELRRELEWIPLAAIRKDRDERYQSPAELADDVRNYLAGRPLKARPQSAWYSARKWAKRHRGFAMAAILILASLSAGIGGLLRSTLIARSAAARERYSSYVAHITAADFALELGKTRTAQEHLSACPEQLRNWEWGYLNALSDTSLVTLGQVAEPIKYALWSPDGTKILAQYARRAALYNARTGQELTVLRTPDVALLGNQFSPDGRQIVVVYDSASASSDTDKSALESPRVFDVDSGQEQLALLGNTGQVTSAIHSPDGTRILGIVDSGPACVWDAQTGALLAKLQSDGCSVEHAAFDPDGTRALITYPKCFTDGDISRTNDPRIWDVTGAREVAVLHGHSAAIASAAFSANGFRVVTGSYDGTARVWDPRSGKELHNLQWHEGAVLCVAFSPYGTRVLTGSEDHTARVWDANTGKEMLVLRGHESLVNSIGANPDGDRIVTASDDGTARIWNAGTGNVHVVLRGHRGPVKSAAFDTTGLRVLTHSNDGTARVWDAAMTHLSPMEIPGKYVGRNSDASLVLLASRDGTTSIIETATGKTRASLPEQEWTIRSAACSPTGARAVIVTTDQFARLWNTSTQRVVAVLPDIEEAEFGASDSRVLTLCSDGTYRVWDADSGELLATIPECNGRTVSATLSPDGAKVLVTSDQGTSCMWQIATGKQLARFQGPRCERTSTVFSAAGDWAAVTYSAASDESPVLVWDTRTGRQITTFPQPRGAAAGVRTSPRGDRLVVVYSSSWMNTSHSSDGDFTDTQLWDTTTWQLIARLHHDSAPCSAAFSPDGTRLVTSTDDRESQIWDATTGQKLLTLRGYGRNSDDSHGFGAEFSADGTRIMTMQPRYESNLLLTYDSVPHQVRMGHPPMAAQGDRGK